MQKMTAITLFVLWLAFVGADTESEDNVFIQFLNYLSQQQQSQSYDKADYPGE